MRRIIACIITLLLLSACSADPATVTESPAPTPSDIPLPTVEPATGTDIHTYFPRYIPPMDFEPVSVWQADSYPGNGRALLYLGEESDGVLPFMVLTCGDVYDSIWYDGIETSAFSAEALMPEGSFSQYYGTGEFSTYVCGDIEISEDTLSLSYSGTISEYPDMELATDDYWPRLVDGPPNYSDDVKYLPTRFTKLSDDYITHIMYSMPAVREEIIYCPNSGDTAFLYDTEFSYYTSDPKYAPSLRELKIGDSYEDIVRRFPNSLYGIDPTTLHPTEEFNLMLYGSNSWYYKAYLTYFDGVPAYVNVNAVDRVTFFLDEYLKIIAIGYNIGGERHYSAWLDVTNANST